MNALFVLSLLLTEVPVPTVPTAPPMDIEAAFNASRKPVSLQDALRLTDEKSQDLIAARASAKQIEGKASATLGAVLPEITASASYVYTTAEQKIDPSLFMSGFGPIMNDMIDYSFRNAGPVFGFGQLTPDEAELAKFKQGLAARLANSTSGMKPTVITAHSSFYANLTITQTLFTPQMVLLPAADQSTYAAKLGAGEAREQIMLNVARIYLGIEGLNDIARAAKDAEAVALKREKDARAQASVGMTTDIVLLRALSETAQARSTLATVQGQKVALLAMLEALVGEPIRPVEGTATHVDVTPREESDTPWEQTYLVRANQAGIATLETFNKYDRVAWLPNLVAQAKGNYNSNKALVNTNWVFDAMVGAQWTLFDRGQRLSTQRENDAKTVEGRAKYEAARAKARATWLGAKTSLVSAQVALEQAEAQAQLAERAQKQISSAYEAGAATSLEVSDIDNKRFFAASQAAQARSQLEVRKVELAASEGRLGELLGVGAPKY
jgi:outer membrane protein